MTEAEIIHDAEVIGTEIEPVSHGNLFRTEDPVEIIRRASETADALAAVLNDRKLTKRIGQKDHVLVEGWTLLGTMLGVFPVVEWTRQVPDGWEARVEARTLAGQVVGAAEAECLRTENTWKGRDDYALRSMAQTRAVSKALRGPLGFVVTLAGYEATPAEEMPSERTEPQAKVEGPKPLAAPKSWAKLTEMVAAYDQATHDLFFAFADACRRYLFPDSTDTKSLSKGDRDVLFQKCAGAAMRLREDFEPTELPPPDLEDVRAAFLSVTGVELAIPDEALDEEAAEAAERDA
jgi:hypothetical protein